MYETAFHWNSLHTHTHFPPLHAHLHRGPLYGQRHLPHTCLLSAPLLPLHTTTSGPYYRDNPLIIPYGSFCNLSTAALRAASSATRLSCHHLLRGCISTYLGRTRALTCPTHPVGRDNTWTLRPGISGQPAAVILPQDHRTNGLNTDKHGLLPDSPAFTICVCAGILSASCGEHTHSAGGGRAGREQCTRLGHSGGRTAKRLYAERATSWTFTGERRAGNTPEGERGDRPTRCHEENRLVAAARHHHRSIAWTRWQTTGRKTAGGIERNVPPLCDRPGGQKAGRTYRHQAAAASHGGTPRTCSTLPTTPPDISTGALQHFHILDPLHG